MSLAACSGGGSRAPHMAFRAGDVALERGDFAAAVEEYRQVVDTQPWNWRARLQYSKALLGVGRARDAREQLEIAYTNQPKNPEVIAMLAEAMGASGDNEGAVRLLSTIAEERRRPEEWERLGRFAQRARDFDTAERAFLSAARGDAGLSAKYQLALYQFYNEVGREEEALQRLAMAHWLEPQNKQIELMIRELGAVPGPTFAIRPNEQASERRPEPSWAR